MYLLTQFSSALINLWRSNADEGLYRQLVYSKEPNKHLKEAIFLSFTPPRQKMNQTGHSTFNRGEGLLLQSKKKEKKQVSNKYCHSMPVRGGKCLSNPVV